MPFERRSYRYGRILRSNRRRRGEQRHADRQRVTKISGIHVRNVKVSETGLQPFRILGDKRAPVQDVSLDNITVGKAHIAKSRYENAEDIRETNITIGEILPEEKEKQPEK